MYKDVWNWTLGRLQNLRTRKRYAQHEICCERRTPAGSVFTTLILAVRDAAYQTFLDVVNFR
jgi:hypothetical protein